MERIVTYVGAPLDGETMDVSDWSDDAVRQGGPGGLLAGPGRGSVGVAVPRASGGVSGPAADGPGPRVRVRLPDGQHITARLTERRRRADGTWWYVVTLALWSELDDAWGHHPTPYDVVMVVPVESCMAIPGQDYSGVPTVRERATDH